MDDVFPPIVQLAISLSLDPRKMVQPPGQVVFRIATPGKTIDFRESASQVRIGQEIVAIGKYSPSVLTIVESGRDSVYR